MCDSAVGPIFNENFVEKKRFVHPINNAQDPRERERERERERKKEKGRCRCMNMERNPNRA